MAKEDLKKLEYFMVFIFDVVPKVNQYLIGV